MEENYSYEKRQVLRIIQGDEEAFREAFYQYKDRLFSYCCRFTKSEELAEEIVHDALLKVWTERQRLDPGRSFVGYLYTITRNMALNFLKKSASEAGLREKARIRFIHWHNETEEMLYHADLVQMTNQAVGQLPPQQQRIYRMSRDQQMTHEEIAQRLDISRHTVRNHIIKALQAIKSYLRLHADISFLLLYQLSACLLTY